MLRFFDPIVHYTDATSLVAVGGVGVGGTVAVLSSGGFQGGSHLQLSSGVAGQVDFDFSGALNESSFGGINDSDVFVSFKVKIDAQETALPLLTVLESATPLGSIKLTPNMGVQLLDKAAATVAYAGNVFKQGTWHHVMVRVETINGGAFQMYVDGQLRLSTTGDFSAAVFADQLEFGDSGTAPVGDVHLDEFIIWDGEVGSDGIDSAFVFNSMHVALPDSTSAAPTTIVGAATAHQAQDDPLNADNDGDTTYVELTDVDLMSVGFPALPSQTGAVIGLGVMAEITEGADLQPGTAVLRVDSSGTPGTDFDLTPGIDNVSGYEMFRHSEPIDPNTASAWTVGGAEAAEVQVETNTVVVGDPSTIISAGDQLLWVRWDLGVTQGSPPLVDQWDDSSLDSYVLDLVSVSTARPDFVASGGLNGNGYLSFDRTNTEQIYATGSAIAPSAPLCHAYMIYRFNDPPLPNRVLFSVGQSNLFNPNDKFMYLLATDTGWIIAMRTTTGFAFNSSISDTHDANWHLVELWYDGSNLRMSRDNGVVTGSAAASGDMNISLNTSITIAAVDPIGGSTNAGIDVGEFFVTQAVVSAPNQASLITYFNSYWGLSL